MRNLIAVVTCQKNSAKADIQRKTWARDSIYFDVRFFRGGQESSFGDTVFLPCSDSYQELPLKVQKAFEWGQRNGYDNILKTDDDTLVVPENFSKLVKQIKADYIGCNNGSVPQYCSGFGYVLSNKAASVVARADWNKDWAEDRWVGGVLRESGINLVDDERFIFSKFWPPRCRQHRREPQGCSFCLEVEHSLIVFCPMHSSFSVEDLYERNVNARRGCNADVSSP